MSKRKTHPLTILKQAGIATLNDLDTYSLAHPYTDACGRLACMSRYQVLKKLVGEQTATNMLHELSLKQCLMAKTI